METVQTRCHSIIMIIQAIHFHIILPIRFPDIKTIRFCKIQPIHFIAFGLYDTVQTIQKRIARMQCNVLTRDAPADWLTSHYASLTSKRV